MLQNVSVSLVFGDPRRRRVLLKKPAIAGRVRSGITSDLAACYVRKQGRTHFSLNSGSGWAIRGCVVFSEPFNRRTVM